VFPRVLGVRTTEDKLLTSPQCHVKGGGIFCVLTQIGGSLPIGVP